MPASKHSRRRRLLASRSPTGSSGDCARAPCQFPGGNAATTPRIALAVAEMLDGRPMPIVPSSGQGGAGEDPGALSALRRTHPALRSRGQGTGIADQRLALRSRFARRCGAGRKAPRILIEQVFACRSRPSARHSSTTTVRSRSCGATGMKRPPWPDFRRLLEGGGERRNYQAPVSYRIVPRVLGHASRALAARSRRQRCRSARRPTIRSTYRPTGHPLGRCISTGGYHNAMAAPALDDLAAIWADICLLCDRHASKLLNGRSGASRSADGGPASQRQRRSWQPGYVPMATTGYLEQAKLAAQRTLSRDGIGGRRPG